MTFDATKLASGGYVTVTDITVVEGSKSKFENSEVPDVLTDGTDDNNALLAQVNEHKYGYYKGGVAYYPVKIRHFADGEVKAWGPGETSYNSEADFLGRWGVLRNNWYNINVTGIKTIGSPEVPEVYPTPDDPLRRGCPFPSTCSRGLSARRVLTSDSAPHPRRAAAERV